MESSPYDTDPAVNSQLTEKFSYKTDYILDLDGIKKCNYAQQNNKAYELNFSKVDHFKLNFNCLITEEHDINWSHEVMLKIKPTLHSRQFIDIAPHPETLAIATWTSIPNIPPPIF